MHVSGHWNQLRLTKEAEEPSPAQCQVWRSDMRRQKNKRLEKCAGRVVKQLAELRAERRRIAMRAFALIRRHDPKTARLAEQVLGGPAEAAYWFAAPHFREETSFWDVIVFGDMPKIRGILAGYKTQTSRRAARERADRGDL